MGKIKKYFSTHSSEISFIFFLFKKFDFRFEIKFNFTCLKGFY